ncbi:hypothetical protein B0T13DRAFT_459121 [Neurospora crassa]|nr:hypothetical protein B0T13DRAFT_459121 [Neurospora crassa]
MDNVIRHGSVCEDCQDKKQQAIQREGEMVWRRGRGRVEKQSRIRERERGRKEIEG